jgi:3-dehydroquinate synthase
MKLKISHPQPYPIEIGTLPPVVAGPKALLFDQAVSGFAQSFAEAQGIPRKLGLVGGEPIKTMETYAQVLSWLAGLPRDTTLYVMGGGSLTDLGGFVAATYLRGIAFISLPTTTLGAVDASVGGKNGLNLPEGKNLVGTFYAPKGVYIPLEPLQTLPQALFKEGLVEAFKHGLISGQEALLKPPSAVGAGFEEYLAQAIQVKIDTVEADPYEQNQRRKLNLGHTLGHALEAATHHQLSHGHAVAYGLLYAALLGRALGGQDLVPTVTAFLHWLSPPPLPQLSWPELVRYMAHDKKTLGSQLFWVVPLALGHLEVRPVPSDILESCYAELLQPN